MGGELTGLLIGILLFGMFLSGVTLFYGDMSSSYNVSSTDISNISYTDSFTTKAQQIKESVKQNTAEDSGTQFGVSGFLLSLELILDSTSSFGALITGGIEALNTSGIPIPVYVATGLFSIVAIYISLSVLGAILKKDV